MAVSAVEGTGLAELRATLDGVLAGVPDPATTGRVRLWVDRSFTIKGAGTVVTGTLAAGTLVQGDRLQLLGHDGSRSVVVRGLQSRDTSYSSLGPVNRVALNLRDVSAADVRRGDALLTPDAWPVTGVLGIHRTTGVAYTDVPEQLMVHAGTAAVPARLRPFGADHARLVLDRRLPLVLGDRLVLRDPGTRSVLGGAQVLDADPPALRRRGDGIHWAERLAGMDAAGDVLGEVAARGAVQEEHLRRLGLLSAHDAGATRRPGSGRLVGARSRSSRHGSIGCARPSGHCMSAIPSPRAFPGARPGTCSTCPMSGFLTRSSAKQVWNRRAATSGCQAPKATLAPSGRRSRNWSAG